MAHRSSKAAIILCLFQSLAGFIFGWENSSTSGLFALPAYLERFGTCQNFGADGACLNYFMPTIRTSTISGIFCIGAFMGALGSGPISSRLGLRITCLMFIFIYMVGVAIECSAFNTWAQIIVGRWAAGLGVGATSGLVPVFQAEAAPPAYRGLITGSFQLCVTLGIFLVNCTTYGMSRHSGDITWRFPVGLSLVFAAILFVGFALSPESPSFLAGKGDWDKARQNLARLRALPVDDQEIDIEIEELRITKAEEAERGAASYKEVLSFKDRIAYRTAIGVLVQVFQQTSGVNFYFSFGTIFAQYAQISDTFIFIIILSAVNVAMSFPGILAVDRFGRRTVLLFGCFVMFSSQIIVGAVSTARPGDQQAGKALIAFSAIFIAGFASTIGPVAWVVSAEVFPSRLAAKCVTLAVAGNWGMAVLISFLAPIVQNSIGTRITFVWAGFLVATFLFVFFFVPETAGLSIEEIDAMFLSNVAPWKSSSFRQSQEMEEIKGAEKRHSTAEHREAAEKNLASNVTSARTSMDA